MLLFDMDGTLIDSNGIWKDVDTRFLEKRGLPYTQEYYEGVAHTIFPLAAKFTKEFCHLPESEEVIMAEWMEMAGDIYATDVTEKPGVRADPPGPAALFRAYFLRPGAGHREKIPRPLGEGRRRTGRLPRRLHPVRRLRGGHPGRQGCRDAHRGRGRPLLCLHR